MAQQSKKYIPGADSKSARPSRSIHHNLSNPITTTVKFSLGSASALMVEPYFAFLHWEIDDRMMKDAGRISGPRSKKVIRIYEQIEDHYEWHKDIEIFDHTGNIFLKLSRANQQIIFDVGVKNSRNEFVHIARSTQMTLTREIKDDQNGVGWKVKKGSSHQAAAIPSQTDLHRMDESAEVDPKLMRKILGPFFHNLFLKGDLSSIQGSTLEAMFNDL